MLQIINNIEDLKAIKKKLEIVYHQHVHLSFFSPAYVIASFERNLASDKRNYLFFVLNKIGNEIINYIPFYIDENKTLRFIFDKHTDYCGSIGADMSFSMLKDLFKLVINHKEIKYIELDNLLPNDSLLNSFKHFFGLGVVITCYNNHSFINTYSSNDFFTQLKSKEKSELKRIQKKNENYNFEVFDGEKTFPTSEIRLLRDQMIANKSRAIDFFDDSFLSLIELLYNAGELEIFSKWDQDRMVSSSMVLKNEVNGFRMVWIDLFADIQFINLSAYIDYIYHLQFYPKILFSFGRGSYDYKANNFQPNLQNLYNLRYSKSKFSFFFSYFHSIKQLSKRIIRESK